MLLPSLFTDRIKKVFPSQSQNILEALETQEIKKTFRINPNKITLKELQAFIPDDTLEVINIGDNIFSTQQKRLYTKNPLILSGCYYFQDLASMLPTLILDIQPDEYILDACASPGSKSTHILSLLGKQGKLIANEFTKTRVGRLIENIARWGCANVFICSQDTKQFNSLEQTFDKVLIDAPCSGEGMFYKNEETIKEWSPALVQKCARLQKQIIQNLLPTLKVGGELVYSTCTLSIEENESIVQFILTEYKGMIELIDFSDFWEGGDKGLASYNNDVFDPSIPKYTRRIFPYHQNFKGEAFFIAKFKILKPIKSLANTSKKVRYEDHWDIPKKLVHQYVKDMSLQDLKTDDIFALGHFLYAQKSWSKQSLKELITLLHPVYVGCRLGTLKKDWIEPSNELSTSLVYPLKNNLMLDLNLEQIAKYLLGEEQLLSIHTKKAEFKLISYQNQKLGFAKLMPNGVLKSYYKMSQGKKVIS